MKIVVAALLLLAVRSDANQYEGELTAAVENLQGALNAWNMKDEWSINDYFVTVNPSLLTAVQPELLVGLDDIRSWLVETLEEVTLEFTQIEFYLTNSRQQGFILFNADTFNECGQRLATYSVTVTIYHKPITRACDVALQLIHDYSPDGESYSKDGIIEAVKVLGGLLKAANFEEIEWSKVFQPDAFLVFDGLEFNGLTEISEVLDWFLADLAKVEFVNEGSRLITVHKFGGKALVTFFFRTYNSYFPDQVYEVYLVTAVLTINHRGEIMVCKAVIQLAHDGNVPLK